jgi:glutathione S-transferase
MRWALAQHDPQDWRLLDDADGQALTAALVEENDRVFKLHLNRYKYPERHPEYSKEHYRSEGENFLRRLEALLEARPFLAAEHPSLADVAVLPFIRQFAHVDRDWFAQAPYPRLQDWLQGFLDSELFLAIMAK